MKWPGGASAPPPPPPPPPHPHCVPYHQYYPGYATAPTLAPTSGRTGLFIVATALSRYRKEGETLSQFLIALRAIAGNCGFGVSLNDAYEINWLLALTTIIGKENYFEYIPRMKLPFNKLEQAHDQQQRIQALEKNNTGTEPGILRVNVIHENTTHARGNMRNTSGFSPKELEGGRDCLRCGCTVLERSAPLKDRVICNSCGASNHFASVCMKSKRATVTHHVQGGPTKTKTSECSSN